MLWLISRMPPVCFIPTLVVIGLIIVSCLQVTFSLSATPRTKAASAWVTLGLAILCAMDLHTETIGFVVVFTAIHVTSVISYAMSHILARLPLSSASDTRQSGA